MIDRSRSARGLRPWTRPWRSCRTRIASTLRPRSRDSPRPRRRRRLLPHPGAPCKVSGSSLAELVLCHAGVRAGFWRGCAHAFVGMRNFFWSCLVGLGCIAVIDAVPSVKIVVRGQSRSCFSSCAVGLGESELCFLVRTAKFGLAQENCILSEWWFPAAGFRVLAVSI